MPSWRWALLSFAVVTLTGCSWFKPDEQLVKEQTSCGLFKLLTVSQPHEPLYKSRFGFCSQVDKPDDKPLFAPSYYSDAACTHQVDYKPTPFFDYCRSNLLNPYNHDYIGNAAAWEGDGDDSASLGKSSKWTLSHGPALDILALSPKGNHRPFMKQVEYREVDGCHLEMRIYRENLTRQNLKPVMLIHGGAWKYRGFGAVGGEALISQLTERGFIVFEPYYRLMGDTDGPRECRIPAPRDGKVPGELIVSDVEAALQWVRQHGATFGAAPSTRVSLVGQSAGAHLSQWLAAHHGAAIEKALLFYSPADIKNYVQEIGRTYPLNHEGRALIEQFVGVTDLTTIRDQIPPFVQQNSFPELAQNDRDHPPLFMIHGNKDSLVPVEMSLRMCNALASASQSRPTLQANGQYLCGASRGVGNILHLIDGANHILDLKCMVDDTSGHLLKSQLHGIDRLCPSGSRSTTEDVVRPSMEQGFNWLL